MDVFTSKSSFSFIKIRMRHVRIIFLEEVMKKTRLFAAILSVLTLLCSIFILASCGEADHVHNYSTEWAKDGSYHWQACSGCEEVRNKAEHDWNSGVVTLQPTLTNEGARTYTCNTCGHTKVESIPVLGDHVHTFSESWSSNETHHWYGATCEHTDEKKDYSEHTWNAGEITTPPTESNDGVKTYTCSACSATRTETVPAPGDSHVHDYDQQAATEAYLVHEATCSHKAVYRYSCVCGAKGTETFEYGDYADHAYSGTWSFSDTHHWNSAICEHTEEKKNYGEHDWDSGVITTEPTASSEGVRTFTCQSCSAVKTESVPKLEEDHTHVFDRQITADDYRNTAATCVEKATYFYSCSCGEKGTETFVYGSLTEHRFTAYIPNGDATCTKDGTKTATCDVCKTATDEVVDVGSATGHSFSAEWSSDSTFHWHASTCGHTDEISDHETHRWDDGVVTKQPTNTTEGEKTYTCEVCKRTKVDNIGILGHVHSFATEYSFDDNDHWYAATCEHGSEVKDKAAHSWDGGIVASEATVYDDGVMLYTCLVCGHFREETIARIPSFTVVFYDGNNKILSQSNYKLNTAADQIVIPAIQAEDGFLLDQWMNIHDSKNISEIDFTKAQENGVYQFKPIFVQLHEVVFIDHEGNRLGDSLTVKNQEKLLAHQLPDIPPRPGYTSKWNEQILSIEITESVVFAPVYEIITCEVTFLDAKNGNTLATYTVDYGSFAMIPEYDSYRIDSANTKLYGFTGWKASATDEWIETVVGNKLTGVYGDMTVYAVYEESIEQPVLAVHIDGTTVTMSLCMPDGSSLYSINLAMGWVTEKGICEITGTRISSVTPLNKGYCEEESCTVYAEKSDWLVYNNKARTVNFIWSCGNGHSFVTSSNVITLTFGVDNGAQFNESVLTILNSSNIVYGKNDDNVNDLEKSDIAIWFY